MSYSKLSIDHWIHFVKLDKRRVHSSMSQCANSHNDGYNAVFHWYWKCNIMIYERSSGWIDEKVTLFPNLLSRCPSPYIFHYLHILSYESRTVAHDNSHKPSWLIPWLNRALQLGYSLSPYLLLLLFENQPSCSRYPDSGWDRPLKVTHSILSIGISLPKRHGTLNVTLLVLLLVDCYLLMITIYSPNSG